MLRWRRVVVARPWLIFLVGRTWPCLRSSPSSGGRPAFSARRRLADRSARARFDLFLVGSLHLAQDAPFVLQLGSALLLGVMRLAEMSCCRRDGPRLILRAAADALVLVYASCLNFLRVRTPSRGAVARTRRLRGVSARRDGRSLSDLCSPLLSHCRSDAAAGLGARLSRASKETY